MPQLIESCHAQMKACIEEMDQQLANT